MVSERQLPSFFGLTSEQVEEIIRDVSLERDGTLVYYAPDVHDIAEFCFPVNPVNPREIDFGRVADHQLAMSEVFLQRKPRPLLLKEYEHELIRNDNAIEIAKKDIPKRADLVEEMLAHIDSVPDMKRLPDRVIQDLENNFNVLVAIRAGIHLIGYDLWKLVVNGRLLREANWGNEVDADLREACTSYQSSDLANHIARSLIKRIPPGLLPTRDFQRVRAAKTDAAAIDKLLHINRYLDDTAQTRPNKKRILVLYLASAARNTDIFGMPEVREALPTVGGKKLSPWRIRDQILLGIVLRAGGLWTRGDDVDSYNEVIENLRQFQRVLSDVRGVRRKCDDCIMDGGKGSDECPAIKLCSLISGFPSRQRARDFLEKDGTSYQNLGLLGNIECFADILANKRPHKEDHRDRGRSRQVANKHVWKGVKPREVVALFRSLLKERDIQELALRKLWVVQQRMEMGAQLIQWAEPAIKDEVITAPAQVLPLAIIVPESPYRAIMSNLAGLWIGSQHDQDHFRESLGQLYYQFIELDRLVSQFTPMHELVRAVIFLSFEEVGVRTGRSLGRIEHIVTRLSRENDECIKLWDVEFQYVLMFALRREKKFQACDDLAKKLMQAHPSNAKVWHAALLNRYAWYEDGKAPYSVAQLIECAEGALRLYEEGSGDYAKTFCNENLIDRLIEVCLNNIAYLCCFGDPPENLALAQQYLDRLARRMPRDAWSNAYPQYGETAAMLLYKEAQTLGSDSRGKAIEKLKAAEELMDRVLAGCRTKEYMKFRAKIREALQAT